VAVDELVALAPVPTAFRVQKLTGVVGLSVRLVVGTPSGTAVYFLDPDTARKVAEGLQEAAGGLVVAAPAPETLYAINRAQRRHPGP
jgi:hypothetical protein